MKRCLTAFSMESGFCVWLRLQTSDRLLEVVASCTDRRHFPAEGLKHWHTCCEYTHVVNTHFCWSFTNRTFLFNKSKSFLQVVISVLDWLNFFELLPGSFETPCELMRVCPRCGDFKKVGLAFLFHNTIGGRKSKTFFKKNDLKKRNYIVTIASVKVVDNQEVYHWLLIVI